MNKGVKSVKAINLLSLLSAKRDLSSSKFMKYIEQFGINPKIRDSELKDLSSLVEKLTENNDLLHIFNGFYVGYMIDRIGKEFDLLRIDENSVINIELKRESTEERITKQLLQNQYYLKFLDIKIYNFTYVSSTKKLYALVDSNHIEEVDFATLIEALKEQTLKNITTLDELFDPTNYLVSPFNSPAAFMEDKYFLNAQQSTYKREIFEMEPIDHSIFISIEGGPGTGKTLLTYDIAKEYLRNSKKVLIFNCGKLNSGHIELKQKFHWTIKPISSFKFNSDYDFKNYDLIILDEAQRLYKYKFFKLVELLLPLKLKCIFSFDPNQCLTTYEINNNVPKLINDRLNPKKFELTTVIRHNKEIHSFITNLFDLSKQAQVQKYSSISIQYFSSQNATRSYLQYLKHDGWKIIDYTQTKYIEAPDNDHFIYARENNPDVMGLEFDNVVAVIDHSFFYNDNNKLSTIVDGKKSFYHPAKMLFQNINRTRRKLHIVIINNPHVLDKILDILN